MRTDPTEETAGCIMGMTMFVMFVVIMLFAAGVVTAIYLALKHWG